MKKIIFILSIVLFVGCAPKEKLYVYNWTYYTPPQVIKQFEKEFNVKVVYDEFATNEEMYAKLMAGGGRYDIVFPSEDYVPMMIKQGMFEKINHSQIPNLSNIDPIIFTFSPDPKMQYSVPYYYGAAGILVNTSKVPNFERSWSIFSRQDLKGNMVMLDDVRETMSGALIMLGYSINTRCIKEIHEARDYININWKPNLLKFDSEAFGKGYAQGDFWVVHGYPETVFEEIADNEQLINNTVFFIPEEGGTSYLDSMCILKNARNIELAHKFINFIHRPDIYAEICRSFGFPATVNVPAREFIDFEPIYVVEDLVNTTLKASLEEAHEIYINAWFSTIRN